MAQQVHKGWPKDKPRSEVNRENCKRGWVKRRERITLAKQRAALEQNIILLNATADDFRALAELEPQECN